jgi:hypothetical protein
VGEQTPKRKPNRGNTRAKKRRKKMVKGKTGLFSFVKTPWTRPEEKNIVLIEFPPVAFAGIWLAYD